MHRLIKAYSNIMKKSANNIFRFSFLAHLLIFFAHQETSTFLFDFAAAQNATTAAVVVKKVNVGVVVDYDGWIGRIGLRCVEMAVSEFYLSHSHYNTRLVLHARDSKSSHVVGAASAALDLIKNVQVQAILGSMTSTRANFVVDLGQKARVPIISYSTTGPSLNQRSSYFLEAAQSVASQMKAISAIVKAFRWTKVLPVFSDIMYSEGVIPCLTDALRQGNAIAYATLTYVSVVSSSSTDGQLDEELRKLNGTQTRVFIVHADVSTGMRIFTKANELGMMKEGYVWITTDEMTSFLTSMKSSVIDSMQGVLGIKTYVPETKALKEFRARWRKWRFQRENQTTYGDLKFNNAFGLRAYDAATALAMAVEEVVNDPNHPGFGKENVSGDLTDHLEAFRVPVSQNGPKLLQALSNSKLTNGLSGEFTLASSSPRFIDSSTSQIVNVHGSGVKVVGFWTPQSGLVRHLHSKKSSSMYSNSTPKDNLGLIIWPGESTVVPKGWEVSIGRLRIGVPVKRGLTEFVKVEYDSVTNKTNVTGYCIDIFKAVVQRLPYELDYEFIPYQPYMNLYDYLISQVYLGRFDAAVGDITITTNRSMYVDFTFPFTESGISIIMPAKFRNNTNTWIFLKPWTWDLWVLVSSFFIFNAFVFWALEHQINEDFQGPPSYQTGTSLWFSFSTMVYAHREKVVNNLARFVLVIWIFVVLVLTQCYAASLTSFLTIQQLKPPNTDSVLLELIKKGEKVAYQSHVVYEPLKKLGFADSQLWRHHTLEDARDLMSNGTVAAIIDEIPYNKLFLAKYCSNYGYYDIVDKRLRADGFAFVFQKGSPLTQDFSKALMETIRESELMAPIENKWLGRRTDCKDPMEEVVSSNRLGPQSFWGLFLISGFSSLSALAIHLVIRLRGRWRRIVMNSAPAEASVWEIFCLGFKAFHKKHSTADLSSVVVPVEDTENASDQQISSSSYSSHEDMNSSTVFGNFTDNHEPSNVELTIQKNEILPSSQ